jgi:ferritin
MPDISNKIVKLITEQIHAEFESHSNYLAMSAYFECTPYKGFSKWMKLQAEEEHVHGHKLFDYLAARGATILLKGLSAPKTAFKSAKEVFADALGYEFKTTTSINKIYEAALAEKDFATIEMLNWFVKEQVEEEESARDILDRVTLAGSDVSALLRLDHEAGERK